jgi:hypothetical protein
VCKVEQPAGLSQSDISNSSATPPPLLAPQTALARSMIDPSMMVLYSTPSQYAMLPLLLIDWQKPHTQRKWHKRCPRPSQGFLASQTRHRNSGFLYGYRLPCPCYKAEDVHTVQSVASHGCGSLQWTSSPLARIHTVSYSLSDTPAPSAS